MQGLATSLSTGTDGSWLVVDRGPAGQQRIAITREDEREAAEREADTLTQRDTSTSGLDQSREDPFGVDQLVESIGAAIDAEHNFNHLLP